MIDAIAQRNNVEPSLVHSVIKAESNYNPLALSPKGAQGLMQLIPSTARRFGVSNTFNAEQNIEGGVKYLKFLIDLYQNDYKKVIAAYNAGEGAVAKYGGIPPYAETINYVYQVGRNLKAARQYAERKAKVAAPQEQHPSTPVNAQEYHPIQSVVAADGRVYYKTQ
ncbi:MAG: Lytic transglycosylase, catalytic [Bryobacterales bacterium]|nr:Lytic transglycosylase, catalytic [Bryobacterales bacterium]